jgi:hypothetical protein
MLLWDSNHLIPFNDIAEVQEPPAKFLAAQMQGRSQLVQTNPTTMFGNTSIPTEDEQLQ